MNVFTDVVLPVLERMMPVWRETANLAPLISRSETLQKTKYADIPKRRAVATQDDFEGDSSAKQWGIDTVRLTINQRCRTPFKLRRIEQAFTEIDLAKDFVEPAVKTVIRKIDQSIALAAHLGLADNRLGTNTPMQRAHITKAKELIKTGGDDAQAQVLALCPASVTTLSNDKDLTNWFAHTGNASVMTGELPRIDGLMLAETSAIYSPEAQRHVNLVFNSEFMRIRFADLLAKSMPEYYQGDAQQYIDPKSGIALYFITQKDVDGVTFMFDVAWGIAVTDDKLGVAIDVTE